MRLVDRILSLRGVGTMQCATPVRVHSAGEWPFPIVRVLRASYLELTLPPLQQKNDEGGTVGARPSQRRRPEQTSSLCSARGRGLTPVAVARRGRHE